MAVTLTLRGLAETMRSPVRVWSRALLILHLSAHYLYLNCHCEPSENKSYCHEAEIFE